MPDSTSIRMPDDLGKWVESISTEGRTKTDVILQCIQQVKEWLESGIDKNEYVVPTSMELPPPCTHRVTIKGKDGLEFWCVFRRPCTPVYQTKIKSIDVCSSCKAQEFALPTKTISELDEQEPEPIKPVVTIPMQPNWNPKQANVRKADGSKMCPFSVNPKFSLDCYKCKMHEREKQEQCIQLHALISINTQN